jgi:hypothetical protein
MKLLIIQFYAFSCNPMFPNILFIIPISNTPDMCRIWGSHSGGYVEHYRLVSYWFARESQWVVAVSFCPTGEPTETEFHSSTSLLFPL